MIFAKIENGRCTGVRSSNAYKESDKLANEVIVDSMSVYNKAFINGGFVPDQTYLDIVEAAKPTPRPRKVSVTDFKLLFTSAERVAIKQSTDPAVQDFYDLLQDPRVQNVDTSIQSVQDAVMYLEAVAQILGAGRAQEILDACKK